MAAVRLCPGTAHSSSVIHQTMAEIASFLGRDQFPKLHFHLFRVFYAIHQSYAVDQADTMGICYDGWLSKYVTHDQIGTLSSHARQF